LTYTGSMSVPVLRLALPLPLPQLFDYRPPAGLSAEPGLIGRRARVPFGSRSLIGVIAEVGPPERAEAPLREAEAVLDAAPLLHGELLASLRWLARYTHAPLGDVLSTALPATLRRGEPLPETQGWAWRLTEAGRTALPRLRGRPRRVAEVLAGLPAAQRQDTRGPAAEPAARHAADERPEGDGIDEIRLDTTLDDWRTAARSLRERGLAERIPIDPDILRPAAGPGPALNPEQIAALSTLRALAGARGVADEGTDGDIHSDPAPPDPAPPDPAPPDPAPPGPAPPGPDVRHSDVRDPNGDDPDEDTGSIRRSSLGEPPPPDSPAWNRTHPAPTVFAPALLEGVTGSGKTEVYLHAIADCLARGRQALVLVPEIGLTPQTLARFRGRLGVPVHALHSGLADGERARVWAAAARGEARVIVGTRSAVFVPLPEAGLIVIDEEHDGSYKQQDGIRYHARDFALVRARTLGVPILLGSATPALETLHNARTGRYAHLRLRARAGDARPPAVRVLDVRKRPLTAGLSPELLDGLQRCLDTGGQALVFRNRRGYAPVLQCHDCGWSAHCRRCGTPERPSPLTVHGGGRRLQCHHCGARQTPPPACPDCAGLALQPQGAGTERIEEALAERFPDVAVLRIDSASTRRKDAFQQQLARLGDAPGILVGTQMLAKGHDLPGLTLVAVVGVDEGLFSADFRAGEKLAQLLIQVAGRAGRAARAGEVLLQTHHPEHPLLQTLIHGGYRAFADGELALREAAGFPPFAHLALLRAEAQQADAPAAFLQAAGSLLRSRLPPGARGAAQAGPAPAPAIELHGPLPAPMARRAGVHRAQLLLIAARRQALHALLDATLPALYALPEARRVRWSLDVDPVDLY